MCHSCPLGKHVQLPFVRFQFINNRPFDIIHRDVWTFLVSSPSGYKYYVLFLDHYTNFLWTFPLFRKSQVYDIFVNFYVFVHTQFELKIKSFQCDHEGEFDNKLFHNFCNNRGIHLLFSCPHTSSQNGNPKEKFVPSIILFVLYCVMLLSPRLFGFTP